MKIVKVGDMIINKDSKQKVFVKLIRIRENKTLIFKNLINLRTCELEIDTVMGCQILDGQSFVYEDSNGDNIISSTKLSNLLYDND